MMKINDVTILRNIIGDKKATEEDDVLKRTMKEVKVHKLNLKKLPKKDLYGRNLELDDLSAMGYRGVNLPKGRERDELIEEATGVKIKKVQLDDDTTRRTAELQKEAALLRAEQALDKLRNPLTKEVGRLSDESRLLEAQALKTLLTPKTREPSMKEINVPLGRTSTGLKRSIGLPVPTAKGLMDSFKDFSRSVATPLTRNLSYAAGGGLVGEFGDEASGRKLEYTIKLKKQYTDYLYNKYSKKGYSVRNEYDLLRVVTPGERKKLGELNAALERDQRLASNKGFLSGAGGRAVLGRSASQIRNPSTFVGMGKTRTPISGFSPSESISRLGVSQGLSTLTSENKWGVLFDEDKGGGVDKLARIIGKPPSTSPTKLDKYIKPFNPKGIQSKLKMR